MPLPVIIAGVLSMGGLTAIGYLLAIVILGIAVIKLYTYIIVLIIFASSIFVVGTLRQKKYLEKRSEPAMVLMLFLIGSVVAFQSKVKSFITTSLTSQSFGGITTHVEQPITYSPVIWTAIMVIPILAYVVLSSKRKLKLPSGGKATIKPSKRPATIFIGLAIMLLAIGSLSITPDRGCFDGADTCVKGEKASIYYVTFKGEVHAKILGIGLETERPSIKQASVLSEKGIEACARLWDDIYLAEECVPVDDLSVFNQESAYTIKIKAYGNPDGTKRTYRWKVTATTDDNDKAEKEGVLRI